MRLTKEEKEILAGDQGEARRFCMELICKSAELRGAETLIPIESAYVGTAWYSGQAQMDFVLRLHSSGAKVSVTTLTAASRVCLADNRLNSDPKIESASRQLAQKLVDIGCLPTFSCSPYNDGHRPKFGSCVAWTESSAVVFANSVLGARTDQGFDFLDLSCAIIGRVPRAGLYLDENRRATSIVDVTGVPESVQNSETFFPVLGQLLGREYSFGVPLIVGLEDTEVSQFRLRALGATASTAGSVRMFHMLGHTPEAEGAIDASRKGEIPVRKLTTFDLLSYTNSLSKALPGAEVSAVCLGAPHISFEEFALIADLLVGRSVKESVTFSATTSRATVAQLEDRGLREVLEDAGMVIVADTCSYLGLIDVGQKGVCMTNSGKWAYYAPMGYPVTPVLGSLQECVESAVVGKVVHLDGFWSDAR